LVTNFGPLNIEVHADFVPKTAENFLELCEKKYYDGIKFHRLIKGFMVNIELTYRYKEEIQLGQGPGVILTLEDNLETNSIQSLLTQVVGSFQWRIAEKTQMDHNCIPFMIDRT